MSVMAILRQMSSPTQANIFRNCSILNRRSIASVGMISASRLRGRAVQQTSQLERVWGVLFWEEGLKLVSPTSSGITSMPRIFKTMCNVEQTPNTAWCRLDDGRRNLYGPPPFVVLFLRSEGAMRPWSIALLMAQSRKGCAISSKSSRHFPFAT